MSKILIVEDDLSIQALLHDFIQEAGYSVVLASDGVEALAKYSEQSFDLVLLDIMLPKIDGFGVCEVIRQKSDVPIIMLTALDDEGNQIKGLDLQADDYITKPFSMPVLLRKIAAMLRHSSKQNDMPQTMRYRDLTLDLEGYRVYTKEESIDLTACCFTTYSFILQAAPKNYQYDIEDADLELVFLPAEFSRTEKEYAYIFLEAFSDWIEEQYENEFELHFFQADGQEVSLHNVDRLVDGQITDFEDVEKTKAYAVSFADSDSLYTLLLTRNTAKLTQTEEAIRRTLPVLCTVVLFGSIISAFFYSWYLTAPIKKVSRLSRQMAEMDFGGFCLAGRTDEIGVLSDSLHTLSRKLEATLSELQEANQKLQADIERERQLEKQRVEFFAAASHELKTPITIIKGQLQGMLYQVGRYKDRETYLAQSLEITDTLSSVPSRQKKCEHEI